MQLSKTGLYITSATLSIFSISTYYKYIEQKKNQEYIISKLTEQKSIINKQTDTINSLQTQIETDAKHSEITTQNQEKDNNINEIKNNNKTPATSNDSIVKFKSYKVAAGDTLITICKSNDIDYYSNKKIILAINGIKNANQIYIGQTLLLPIATKE